jgi:DNA-binding response OmpR family regulator
MILIVDDHADIASATAALMKCEGFEANCVHSGQAALDWVATHLPRLIILDDNMPGMTGFEVLTRLKADARFAQIPILFHSAEQDRDRRERAAKLGSLGWYVKGPESWTIMTARVREILG